MMTAGHRETVRLLARLHQFDVMRANKAPFAFGLEPRVPFLDKAFLETSMSIDPAAKMVRLPLLRFPFPSLLQCREKQGQRTCMHGHTACAKAGAQGTDCQSVCVFGMQLCREQAGLFEI
jgi:hypothetical protein